MSLPLIDLSELRMMWERRRAAAEPMRRRIDPRGMTRPARSPEERRGRADRLRLSHIGVPGTSRARVAHRSPRLRRLGRGTADRICFDPTVSRAARIRCCW